MVLRLDERAGALLEEEGITIGAVDQELLEPVEGRIPAEKRLKELLGTRRREGVDSYLPVVRFAAPGMLVFGAVIGEQEDACRREALHETLEYRLRLTVDPVKVLEDHDERLHVALAQQQALHCVERSLTSLWRIEASPRFIADGHVEKREQRRQGSLQRAVQRQQLAGDLLADLPGVVAWLDLEIAAQQLAHGEIGHRLAVRDARRFDD